MVHTFFKNIGSLSALAGVVLLLPGCGKQPAYHPKSLREIRLTNTSIQTQEQVKIHCKLLNKKEAHALFDGRGSRLWSKRRPIYPLYLCVENHSPKTFILDPSGISLKTVNPELAAERLYAHTGRRIAIPLIAGSLGTGTTFCLALLPQFRAL